MPAAKIYNTTNPPAVASTESIAALGRQVAALWERHHEADVTRTKAPEGSAAHAKADAACQVALGEIQRLTSAMFKAPVRTATDVAALAVAGFEGADVMAASDSSADQRRIHNGLMRTAFAHIATWGAEAAAVPLEQLVDRDTVRLMHAA